MTVVAVCHNQVVTIGERIRAARLRHGWSQPQLAAEVGCSVSQLRKFEYLGDDPPVGSRFFDRTLYLLGVDLAADRSTDAEDDPAAVDDPPVSRATEAQLVNELARRIAERAGERGRTDQSNVAPIEVRGMRFDAGSAEGGPA